MINQLREVCCRRLMAEVGQSFDSEHLKRIVVEAAHVRAEHLLRRSFDEPVLDLVREVMPVALAFPFVNARFEHTEQAAATCLGAEFRANSGVAQRLHCFAEEEWTSHCLADAIEIEDL